ncbi:DOPA-like domain-containing protein [Armillaria fumosa]|nr:DOPA-like domain-containing protein [Armillaria fumosa]
MTMTTKPETDVSIVVANEVREWHFHIYFRQKNASEHHAALELRDAVLRLCRDGAFVAVPLFRVNTEPMGPHPVGSYEIWVPAESFSSVFSFIALNHGQLRDHEHRNAWIGQPFPLDLSALPEKASSVPLQYPSLRMGYSTNVPPLTMEQRKKIGANVTHLLSKEKLAARPPIW